MNCPQCQKDMVTEDFGGVAVDVCKNGCKGIWFEWFELTKLDEMNEGLGNALREALAFPKVNDGDRNPINCPKCKEPLHRHEYQHTKGVNVDECYDCGGFFLDSGELTEIRQNHMSEEEEQAYAQKLVENVPEYGAALQELKQEQQRAQGIRNFTRFMRISYYMTGE